MSDQHPRTVPERLKSAREQLPHMIEEAEAGGPAKLWLSILILLFPYLLFMAFEIGMRIADPPMMPLRPPWAPELDTPYPPLTKYAWTGDLKRIARLPYYDQLVEQGPFPPRYAVRITDEWGFVNKPAGEPPRPVDKKHDIILTGTSYMAEGSTIDFTLASQLSDVLEKPVYNASWPSGGPVTGILYTLTHPEFFQGKADVIILGIIQRYLYSFNFEETFHRLNEDGSVIPAPPSSEQQQKSLQDYLEWRNTLEKYLESTSSIREFSLRAGRYIPPMAFDLGINTSIQISRLKEVENAPILFYPGDIASTYHDYQSRNGNRIVEALRRIQKRCRQMDTHFLVILVPDKYELYRGHVEPPLYSTKNPFPDEKPSHPEHRAPQVLVEQLHEAGIEALDLYPPLHEAQFREPIDELLYWVDDTHWSDNGIRVASQYIGKYIENNIY